MFYLNIDTLEAEGERENDNIGKSRSFAQHPQTEVQILHEVLNPVHAARVAAFLFGLLDALQVESRAAVRLFLRHPSCDVFFGFSFEVVAQLVIQFPAKQRPQPQRNREQPVLWAHDRTSVIRTSKRSSDRRASRAALGCNT
ncbi:MAG TPA: hypothetical protein VM709_05455, partial [Candidatus Sulfotelmatobacter sp.]|nr:hypothetical protein [Candidatus Sulfotelmatobacter sp.]